MNIFNLFCFLTAGSITDLKYRKADNLMILTFFLIDLWLNHGNIGLEEIFQRAAGMIIVFAVLFPVYSVGLIGAGDVKFLMALCMMTGSAILLKALVPITITATILCVLMAIAERNSRSLRIPMLIPISFGVLTVLC
ncbi:MAG: A24 family peptidase [Lachnospiraceae bacterium]|nr:A24 family peptidase [Lachnospiraceae bacterium]